MSRNNITRKKYEYRHFRRCPIERINFLYRISCYNPNTIIDIDETPFNKDEINEDRGYSPKGKRAYKTQIIIRGKSYSIIAAACNRGFLCWAIYDIPVTSDIFIAFLLALFGRDLSPSSTHIFTGIIGGIGTFG